MNFFDLAFLLSLPFSMFNFGMQQTTTEAASSSWNPLTNIRATATITPETALAVNRVSSALEISTRNVSESLTRVSGNFNDGVQAAGTALVAATQSATTSINKVTETVKPVVDAAARTLDTYNRDGTFKIGFDQPTLQTLNSLNNTGRQFLKLCAINGIGAALALTGLFFIAKQLYQDSIVQDDTNNSKSLSWQQIPYEIFKSGYFKGSLAMIAGLLLILKSDALVAAAA